MSGGFYLLGSSNEKIHDNMKNTMEKINQNGLSMPELVTAWQVSYYIMIASLIGEFIWVGLSSVMIIFEGKKIFQTHLI